MEAARRIVCEKGLVNTSIGEITRACGVSSGTFYTHFKRKEDVVFALGRVVFREIFEEARAHDGSFMERLEFFMVCFSGYIEKSGLKLCQEWVRNTVDPDLLTDPDDKGKLASDVSLVRSLLEDAVARGELGADAPVELLAHTLVDLLYGEMLCWDMSGGSYSFEGRTREFCATLLRPMLGPYLATKGKDAR